MILLSSGEELRTPSAVTIAKEEMTHGELPLVAERGPLPAGTGLGTVGIDLIDQEIVLTEEVRPRGLDRLLPEIKKTGPLPVDPLHGDHLCAVDPRTEAGPGRIMTASGKHSTEEIGSA